MNPTSLFNAVFFPRSTNLRRLPFSASFPTLSKCFTHPKSESPKTYALIVLSSLIAVLTVNPWVFVNYGFALYVMIMNVAFTILILMPRKRARKRRKR